MEKETDPRQRSTAGVGPQPDQRTAGASSPAPGPSEGDRAGEYRGTYETLRWLMVAFAAQLGLVSVGTAILTRQLPGSISDFYAGPVRDVFVGVLFAVGACLIAYCGSSPLEDFAFNSAGFYALFVALFPTTLAIRVSAVTPPGQSKPQTLSADDLEVYLKVAYVSLVLLLIAFAAFDTWVAQRQRSTRAARLLVRDPGRNRSFVVASVVVMVAFVIAAGWHVFTGRAGDHWGVHIGGWTWTGLRIHDIAAILLFASLAVAVWTHTSSPDGRRPEGVPGWLWWPQEVPQVKWAPAKQLTRDPAQTTSDFARFYRVVFVGMTVGAVVVAFLGARFWPQHTVLVLEWFEISLFIAFWVTEILRERDARQTAEAARENGDVVSASSEEPSDLTTGVKVPGPSR